MFQLTDQLFGLSKKNDSGGHISITEIVEIIKTRSTFIFVEKCTISTRLVAKYHVSACFTAGI